MGNAETSRPLSPTLLKPLIISSVWGIAKKSVWFKEGWLDPRYLVQDGLGQEMADLIKD